MKADKVSDGAQPSRCASRSWIAVWSSWGLALPARAKAGLRRNKALLREVLKTELPAAITNRPKRGFEIPVDALVRDPSSKSRAREHRLRRIW